MGKKRRILVLGYFGYLTNQLDGQTVKTRDVYRLTTEQRGENNVDWFDTQSLRRNAFSVFMMFWKVIRCDTLFYLPANNNLRVFFPIISLLSLLFRFKIHYFVVGGWLKEFLTHLPLHRAMLKHIAGIHVETKRLKKDLEEYYHYKNVDIFPNFRFFDYQPCPVEADKLRVVFMARVKKQKGLDWIFALADYIVGHGWKEKFSITFYGPIATDEKEYFEECVARYDFVEYRGVLQPQEIHETLSLYDVMLLPTHYYTEGLPGSVVDAYISGIPVIVTEWKHAREFVDDGRSGYIVPFENGLQQLIEKVVMLANNKTLLYQLKANALIKRKDFAAPDLSQYIGEYTSKIGGGNFLRLCFISRVEQAKGLDTLKEIAKLLAKDGLDKYVSIDFYGQKKDGYYDQNLKEISNFQYKGVLQPTEVIETLKKYDALIFPTHYSGEGCPGILVEALMASLPIIASDWKYNSEFVNNGDNGFLCETNDTTAYVEAFKILLTNQTLRRRMAARSYELSERFSAKRAKNILTQIFE